MYKIVFMYDKRGFGDLICKSAGEAEVSIRSRTGSIGVDGKLKNALSPDIYWIRRKSEKPAKCEHEVMELDGIAYKIRLWHYEGGIWIFTHLLIHPDGSMKHHRDRNGTDGCIGTLSGASVIRDWVDERVLKGAIPVEVTCIKS